MGSQRVKHNLVTFISLTCAQHLPHLIFLSQNKFYWLQNCVPGSLLSTLKNVQSEGCFIWGKMKIIAWKRAPQIALRNCSKEAGQGAGVGGGELVFMWFWWRESTWNQAHIFCKRFLLVTGSSCHMKNFNVFLDVRRCKNWAHRISSWKYLTTWRPVLPVSPRAQPELL